MNDSNVVSEDAPSYVPCQCPSWASQITNKKRKKIFKTNEALIFTSQTYLNCSNKKVR